MAKLVNNNKYNQSYWPWNLWITSGVNTARNAELGCFDSLIEHWQSKLQDMLYFTKKGSPWHISKRPELLVNHWKLKLFLDCFFLIKTKKVFNVRKAAEQLLCTKYIIKIHPYKKYRNSFLTCHLWYIWFKVIFGPNFRNLIKTCFKNEIYIGRKHEKLRHMQIKCCFSFNYKTNWDKILESWGWKFTLKQTFYR